MRIINTKGKRFKVMLARILARGIESSGAVESKVSGIILDVRKNRDMALVRYTKKFDGVDVRGAIKVEKVEMEKAVKKIPTGDMKILRLSAKRIEAFHRKQIQKSWFAKDNLAITLGQLVNPIETVGIYAPGGKAVYPSTILMTAIPARVAGVKKIVLTTPPGKDGINPYILAASNIAGVRDIYRVGGAQAIAALAFGTETIPKVDKIVGPGNIYVSTAKRLVSGTVAIDMVAGPSEVLIVNDGSGNQSWVASDMLAQAEHDELASAMLITTSMDMARAVEKEVLRRIKTIERKAIAQESIKNYGAIFVAKNLDEAIEIANSIAPEHLELCVKNPKILLKKIKNAGAIFLGHLTPTVAGDYVAGPSHTLPTGGTARFSSPLGVHDFLKFSSVMEFPKKALSALAGAIERFAEIEGLKAHAESARVRLETPHPGPLPKGEKGF